MNWKEIVIQPFVEMARAVIGYLPYLITAILILLLGHFISKIVKGIVKRVSLTFRLEKISELLGLGKLFGKGDIRYSFASFIGGIAYILVFIVFVYLAAKTMRLESVALYIRNLITYTPNIILAFVFLFIVIFLANFLAGLIKHELETKKSRWANIVSNSLRIFLIVLGVGIALEQLKISTPLLIYTLVILLGGLVLTVSIGIGIAIGLGSKDLVNDVVKRILGSKDSEQENKRS